MEDYEQAIAELAVERFERALSIEKEVLEAKAKKETKQ